MYPSSALRNCLALATSTYYPAWPYDKSDKVRGNLAIQTLKEIKKMGFPLYITDGGSSEDFLGEVTTLGYKISKQKGEGLSASRRQTLTQASLQKGILAIGLFEPEKISFVKDCLIKCVQYLLEKNADLVVPKRNEKSFLSYPDNQSSNEKLLNLKMSKIVINSFKKNGKSIPKGISNIDFLFGPKIISNKPEVLNFFLDKYLCKKVSDEKKIQCETWANALFFPLFACLYNGLKVLNKSVLYIHPQSQTFIESNNPLFIKKRKQQFDTLSAATKEFFLLLENNPTSKIKYVGRFYE